MENSQSPILKECPFCGGAPRQLTYGVRCSNPTCPLTYIEMSHKEWNRRTPSELEVAERVREACVKECRETAMLCPEDVTYDNGLPTQDGQGTAFNRGVVECDRCIRALDLATIVRGKG